MRRGEIFANCNARVVAGLIRGLCSLQAID